MTNISFQDKLYDVGSKTVRMNSVEHLRTHNRFANLSRVDVLRELERYIDEPHGAIRLAHERLTVTGAHHGDKKLLATLIYHGQMYGLGASPQPATIADLLWQAAAIIMEDNRVSHPNEISTPSSDDM